MTRILLIETASPARILEKAETVLNSGVYSNPEVTVLCAEKNRNAYERLAGARVLTLSSPAKYRSIEELARSPFDVLFAFWTGEKRFRRWKLLCLQVKAKQTYILSGDGNEFLFTWKAWMRHAIFRFRHALPTDHRIYAESSGYREEVLIVQSAEPALVLEALNRLKEKSVFINPNYTLFCRNKTEIVNSFRGNPLLPAVLTHFEARDSWKHLRSLRSRRFDAVVLFLTGDPSYWKVKCFAFLLGTRRILIFNESSDCFFFNMRQWLSLLARRFSKPLHSIQGAAASTRWSYSARILVSLGLKLVLFPFRFLWLLLVWLRLRCAGLNS